MSVYTIRQSRVIALCLIFLLGIFLVYSLFPLFTSILGAVVLYVLFKTLYIYLAEKKKIRPAISATLIILLSFIIIIIPFVGLAVLLTNKILYFNEHPETINKIISSAEKFIGKNFDPDLVKNSIEKASGWAVGLLSSFVDATLTTFLTIAMMYFFFYFMLTKYQTFEGTLIKYLPFREKNAAHFAEELKNMTFANIVGQGIIALAQGVSMYIGFLIFGISDAFFWGVICFFLSFLPVIGSAGVFLPVGLVEIASGDSFSGFGIIIFGLVAVSNIDNLLRLWLNKWLGDIHPIITITGIVIGIPVFGILGLVFGPLLISTFILLIRLYEAALADKSSEKERVVSKSEIGN
jgi:predicted PurR-regulated permease PerM